MCSELFALLIKTAYLKDKKNKKRAHTRSPKAHTETEEPEALRDQNEGAARHF